MRALALAALVCAGCAAATSGDVGDAAQQDAGAGDAGSDAGADAGDAGASDSGDAGTVADAGAGLDAGADAGTDAGDAGHASAAAPGIPCADALDSVYLTPPGLPPLTQGHLGDIVRCAPDAQLSTSDESTQLSGKGVTHVTPVSATHTFRLSYRTTRAGTVEGIGTARVFLPQTARSTPLPIVVTAHGSDGLGTSCAPSKDPTGNAELSIPFASQGYAVIAPDYAGLGNDGTQGYLDNPDTAHSVLDAARALRKLIPGAFSNQIVLVGFSQGGGAVLSAQALARAYGADGEVAAVVVFAAQWQTRLDSFAYVQALANPTELTILTGVSKPTVYVMRQYAWQMNHVGTTTGGAAFPANNADNLEGAAQTQCLVAMGASVQTFAPHVGDLFEPAFRTALLACAQSSTADPACTGNGRAFHEFLTGNILTADAAGAPILYTQGLNDIVMDPAEEAACNLDKLRADGADVQVCVDSPAQHTDVVGRNVAFALQWVEAKLAGTSAPTCSAAGLPTCKP